MCSFTQPCQTIPQVESLLTNGQPALVLLRGGIYYWGTTTLTKDGASGSPIVYAAYPYETPIITGAQPLTGWQSASGVGACGGGSYTIPACWKTSIPAGSSLVNFEYLIYVPANWPASYVAYTMSRRNASFNTPSTYNVNAGVVSQTGGDSGCTTNTDSQCSDRVLVYTNDVSTLTTTPHNPQDIKFYNFRNWNVDALRLLSVTAQSGGQTKLVFTGATLSGSFHGFLTGDRYLLANSLEYFQANHTPGTFYIDCGPSTPCVNQSTLAGSSVYYIAQPGEDPTTDLILAPQAAQLVTDNDVNYVTFWGIVFAGDNFVPPSTGYLSDTGQPKATAALSFVDTIGITFDSCTIAHTSGWAVEFTNDSGTSNVGTSVSNQLINSAVYDIGASGIRLGRYPPDNSDTGNSSTLATHNSTVQNNLFRGMGRMYPGGEAGCIFIGSSHDNTIQYNDCGDSYGGGIAMGPGVAYTAAYDYNNTVQYNSFHDIGEGVITDFGCVHVANRGGIAANPTGADTFQNNICHDVTHAVNDPSVSGGIGLYVDNNSQNFTARYNLVYRTADALFLSNASSNCPSPPGCSVTISNNILAYSYAGPIKRGGNDPLLDFTFKHNIVYYDTAGPQLLMNHVPPGDWDCTPPPACTAFFAFYSNDYWSPTLGPPTFVTTTTSPPSSTTWSFSDWQSTALSKPGEDGAVDSATASTKLDPLFTNPTFPVDDYHVGNGNITGTMGIQFDTTSFAATYTAGRNNPAIFPNFTPTTFPPQLLSPFKF